MALIVSVNEASKIFGYDRKTLRQWISEEGAPVVSKGSKGKATLVDTEALSRWLMDRASGRTPMEKARLGKLREEITQLQLERAARQIQLCPIEDVKTLYEGSLEILQRGLKRLPELLSSGDSKLRDRWEREIDSVLAFASERLKVPDTWPDS